MLSDDIMMVFIHLNPTTFRAIQYCFFHRFGQKRRMILSMDGIGRKIQNLLTLLLTFGNFSFLCLLTTTLFLPFALMLSLEE